MNHDFSKLPELINQHPKTAESLVMILQDIQKEYHYLPCEALVETSKALSLPLTRIFSAATFYNAFSLNPKGENVVRICEGTACHIRGAHLVTEQVENALKIKAGETTEDSKFSIEVVACVGACALAPVMIINEEYHGSVRPGSVKKLLKVKRNAD